MRIIHIADTHLGFAAFNVLDADGMNLREKLIYETFLQGVDRIIQERPDVLIHAGDLFDQVRPKTRAYTTVLDGLDRLFEAGIPVVLIAGNHSMVKTRYTTSPFKVLAYHPSHITAAYSFRYECVEIGDTVFHLIPNMLRPVDYRAAYDRIELAEGYHHVLVTHGLASSLRDRRLGTVAEHELDSTILSDRFQYIALGHYHHQSQVADNAWYSGSLEYLSYGEMGDTKGGLSIDLDRGEVHHLPLPHTPMIDLGSIACDARHTREITEEIISRIADSHLPPGAMVQITLEGLSREQGQGPDMRDLVEAQKGLLHLKIRVRGTEEDRPVPDPRDLKTIDYLKEYVSFIDRQPYGERQKTYVRDCGLTALRIALEHHREAGE